MTKQQSQMEEKKIQQKEQALDKKHSQHANNIKDDTHILYPSHWEDFYSYGKIIDGMSSEFVKKEYVLSQRNQISKIDNYIANLREKKDFNNQLYIEAKYPLSPYLLGKNSLGATWSANIS